MFHDIPQAIQDRMTELEQADREGGTFQGLPLWQVSPDTGRFLAVEAAAAPEGRFIEIGSSAGYSGLWLALACRATGRKLTTFEVSEEKARIARETFSAAGVEDVVELVVADAREHLEDLEDVSFCFLDAAKDIYAECYDAIVPRMAPGAILTADNAESHRRTLQPMLEATVADPRMDAVVVPIGDGVLLGRRV